MKLNSEDLFELATLDINANSQKRALKFKRKMKREIKLNSEHLFEERWRTCYTWNKCNVQNRIFFLIQFPYEFNNLKIGKVDEIQKKFLYLQ